MASSSSRWIEVVEVEGNGRVQSRLLQLADEIIRFQILPRLSVKSLMRFKCVCKSWSSTITSDTILSQVKRSKSFIVKHKAKAPGIVVSADTLTAAADGDPHGGRKTEEKKGSESEIWLGFGIPGRKITMEVAEAKGDGVPKIQSLVAELPSEIWFRILPKLPAKSLMRFKCVCKAWLALITRNPSFLTAYRNLHSNRNTSLLLLDLRNIDTKRQHIMSLQINKDGSPSPAGATHLLTLEPQEYSPPIILCTNGLACFIFVREHRIRVFNPCTRESMTLPSTSSSPTSYQSTSPDIKTCGGEVGYGFGFSPVTDEYTVVQVKLCRFLHQEPANFFRAVAVISLQVFTLGGAESWRCVEVEHDDLPFDHTFWHIDRKSVCLHGAIHWIHEEGKCVVVFDLGEQRFRVIPFPREVGSVRHHFWAVVDVGGCLALTYDKERSSISHTAALELWVLKDYQNQVWVKEVFAVAYPYSCLCAIHTGEVLMQSGALSQAFLHFYDTKNQSFRDCSIVVPEWICKKDDCIRWNVLSCYDETIAPVK